MPGGLWRTDREDAGQQAPVFSGAPLTGAAALNAYAQLSGAEQALQGEWEVSWAETLKPALEQQFKELSDEAVRTMLAIMGVNPERMNRKQMVKELTKATVQAGKASGYLPKTIVTFSGNIITIDTIAPDGARTTEGSGSFTADGAAIRGDNGSIPYTLKDNTLIMEIDGGQGICRKVQ